MTASGSRLGGPSPTGDGPPALRHTAALAAMLRAADRQGMAVTVRQVEELLSAAAPHFEVRVEERVVVEVEREVVVRECRRIHVRRATLPTNVPAGPTVAVLRELVASGFPLMHLARMLHTGGTELTQLMQREHVRPGTEQRVLELGERLRGTDPLGWGVSPSGVVRARNYAARHGWTVTRGDAVREGAAPGAAA